MPPRLPGDPRTPSFGVSGQAPRGQPTPVVEASQRVRRLLPLLSGSGDRWPTQATSDQPGSVTAIMTVKEEYELRREQGI